MTFKISKFFSQSLFILLLIMVNLNVFCYKCQFAYRYNYFCNIIPDSSSIVEMHHYGESDKKVVRIILDGTLNDIVHFTRLESDLVCQRFKNLWDFEIFGVKSVGDNLFQQCWKLTQVVIKNSQIREIPENLFLINTNLSAISIYNTNLSLMPENVFLNQNELWTLNLFQNQISCLPSNIFKSLTNLKQLQIDKNKIQSLNPIWFKNLQSLEWLGLSDNKIQDLPKNVFIHLEKLKSLKLSGNQLTIIHSDSFGIRRKLTWIMLENNRINAIDEKLIDNTAVNELYISGNICSNEKIKARNKMKKKLSNCFKNYQPRMDQNSKILSTDCIPEVQCGTRHFVKQLIHGGTEIRRGEYPWNVALIQNISDFFCGGTLISNRHVVTAAHCMKGKHGSHVFGPDDFLLLLGVHNYSKPEEEGRILVGVSRISVNPIWNTDVASYDGDIAVLELTNEVRFNNFIRPICIADENSEVALASSGTVVGFGHNENGILSDIANKLAVPIRNYHECTSYTREYHSYISFRTFCGGPANGSGVCSGDSGGGVYVLFNDQFYLRGLVSASLMNNVNQCNIHKEAIFADVTKYFDWIRYEKLKNQITSTQETFTMPTMKENKKTNSAWACIKSFFTNC